VPGTACRVSGVAYRLDTRKAERDFPFQPFNLPAFSQFFFPDPPLECDSPELWLLPDELGEELGGGLLLCEGEEEGGGDEERGVLEPELLEEDPELLRPEPPLPSWPRPEEPLSPWLLRPEPLSPVWLRPEEPSSP
jgi:hypothetical protein